MKTPVTSFSTVANSYSTFDIKAQWLPCRTSIMSFAMGLPIWIQNMVESFFYGIHLIQPLMFIFGEDITKVKITREGKKGSAALVYKNGLYVTLIFKNKAYGWETFVETPKP
jgi:hypothetical protein